VKTSRHQDVARRKRRIERRLRLRTRAAQQVLARYAVNVFARCAACGTGRPPVATRGPARGTDSAWTVRQGSDGRPNPERVPRDGAQIDLQKATDPLQRGPLARSRFCGPRES
jgi:hypothetical protein